MGINNVGFSVESDWNLTSCLEEIEKDGVLVREIEVVYRCNTGSTSIKPAGIPEMALSTKFMNEIKNQFNILSTEVITPLIEFTKSDFTLFLKVSANGNFSFDELNICLKPEVLREKSIYRRYKNVIRIYSYFAEHLDSFEIQGRQYSVKNIFGNITLSKKDLEIIIEDPVVSPKLKEQWFNFVIEAEEETKKRFNLDVVIPCFEGEVTWETENKFVRLHHLEVKSDRKKSDGKVRV